MFVSYSRHDEQLVKPLAELLGAAADDAIFLDVDSIKPGAIWKTEIDNAVRTSSVFIVCWCCESARSRFVHHEIALALEDDEKRLVPVLFCSTPLPKPLARRQWVDLRGRVTHSCKDHVPEPLMVMAGPSSQPITLHTFNPNLVMILTLLILFGFVCVFHSSIPLSLSIPASIGLPAGAAVALWRFYLQRKRGREADKLAGLAVAYFEELG